MTDQLNVAVPQELDLFTGVELNIQEGPNFREAMKTAAEHYKAKRTVDIAVQIGDVRKEFTFEDFKARLGFT